MKLKKVKCPVCKGTGKVLSRQLGDKKATAHKLRAAGLSIRAIAAKMGFKSPRSIQIYLKERKP